MYILNVEDAIKEVGPWQDFPILNSVIHMCLNVKSFRKSERAKLAKFCCPSDGKKLFERLNQSRTKDEGWSTTS